VNAQISLLVAVLALVLWVALAAALPATVAAVHLLLALGVTLLIRWWALTR
jgi:hypothetical protein